ncbi:DJ-1 protein [Sistotremastrum suecicum HHB10207 ss-3]|uniref:D-lactate dehydratase n=1 Tax=Sistotremastrum suecicum HHB10207 ss-3 TaxID=1314776 RepID=A0A166GEX6_9AGAM|nr:DJ-1 protein [Sistotremastrum suecicum HHB10207 ss-3]
MAPPSALIFIANGTEEMEFTIVYDTLVRAGVTCTSAAVWTADEAKPEHSNIVTCSRGIKIVADTSLQSLDADSIAKYDILVVPGGAKGAETISGDARVQEAIRTHLASKKHVGMICAGSLAAKTSGLAGKYDLTSHPSVKTDLEKDFNYKEDSVVVSDNLITSRGPGTAFLFALQLVEILCGPEKRRAVRDPMIFPSNDYIF